MKNINKTLATWIKAITIIWNIIWIISLYGAYSGLQNGRRSGIEALEQIWSAGLERNIVLGILINVVLFTLFFIFNARAKRIKKTKQQVESAVDSEPRSNDRLTIEKLYVNKFASKPEEYEAQLEIPGISPNSLEGMQNFILKKSQQRSDRQIAATLINVYGISFKDAQSIIAHTMKRPYSDEQELKMKKEMQKTGNTGKTFRVILEIIYVVTLSFLLSTIIWNIEVPYQEYRRDNVRTEIADIDWHDGQNLMISIIGLMTLILIFEWGRRKKLKANRSAFEKYFYIPAIFMVFLMGILIGRFLLISY